MDFETIIYELENRVATITLNRPDALNSTNDQMYKELNYLIGEIAANPEVRCVILTGSGRGFCAGADVRGMDPNMKLLARRARHRGILRNVLRPLFDLEKPVIAAVNGIAVGAGFNIALACDFIVSSDKAMYSQIFTKMGLVPDLGGLYFLTRVVGVNKAKELCFTAKKISAQEAYDLGIVNHIVPHDDLMAEARKIAEDIAAGPPVALAMIKTLLNKSADSTLEQMLEYEGYAQTLAYTTPDHAEGVAAFREKRSPEFGKE